MEITAKQLRIEPGRIISQVNNGQEITITYRGKPRAKIVPIVNKKAISIDGQNDELFGIWEKRKDTENVEEYIRTMRKGRKL